MEKEGVLAIDVGGTKVCIGIVSDEGVIFDSYQYPQYYLEIEEWVQMLIGHLDTLLHRNEKQIKVKAIGIGTRGHVDFKNQRFLSSTIIKVSPGYDLCGRLQKYYHLPVYIDNDVKAAAYGEMKFGVGKKYHNFACYNVGTGIAISIVMEGKLVRGGNNNAGEIAGDIIWDEKPGGTFSGLEEAASGRGIEDQARRRMKDYPLSVLNQENERINTYSILEACRVKKDELAVYVVERALYALASSIISIQHLLDLDVFVMVGGVVSNTWFFEQLKGKVEALSAASGDICSPRLEVSSAEIGKTGLLGAAGVAFGCMERE